MFRTVVKLIVLAAALGVIWWWLDSDVPETAQVEVEEVSYDDVASDAQEDLVEDIVVVEDEVVEESDDPIELVEEEEEIVDEEAQEEVAEESDLPATFNLAVPFTPQAPFANWDLPYQEACEEASAFMVAMYYQGEPSGLINPLDADEAIWELVDFQNDLFGDYLDTTAEQTREFMDLFYNLTVTVQEDPTVEQIKAEIAAGRPVIVPAAGQQLGNPYFSGDGPLYHMLVIKGYTETQFITNDPGTKRGQDFVYDIDVLMAAIGDWNDGDPANGAKRVLFVAP